MSEPNLFRHYLIVQDSEGHHVELSRTAEQVVVLAFDTIRLEFVHCHVMLKPLEERAGFEANCGRLRSHGHPYLARFIDFGEDEGNPFYIVGNVDGEVLGGYLGRHTELPCWLAVMLASRALEAAVALVKRGDFLPVQPLESMRVVQVSSQAMAVLVSDYRLLPGEGGSAVKNRVQRANFEKQGRFLKAFLMEQTGEGPVLPDQTLAAADFAELLGACLQAAGPAVMEPMLELRDGLQKLVPDSLSGEIATAQKPRALIAPLLASYQDVARGVAKQVRIQSQRLDMSHPYSMRGTLAKTGTTVLVEEVPPASAGGKRVLEVDRQVYRLSRKRGNSRLSSLALVQEGDPISCIAEEVVEGIHVAELLQARGALEVQEVYLLLAALDATLSELDQTDIACRKLRLEDLFLLVGNAKEGERKEHHLQTKLNDWPSFSLVARVHPGLAAMAGRGTDPGVLLPPGPTTSADVTTLWHGGWLAAIGRFLLGLEPVVGGPATPVRSGSPGREVETVERLLEDELEKSLAGNPSSRQSVLARYARIVHHYDLVKPIPGVTEIPPADPPIEPAAASEPFEAPTSPVVSSAPAALGSLSLEEVKKEKPTVGFAEILFQGGEEGDRHATPDWADEGGAVALPQEYRDVVGSQPPFWLKMAVFLLGSMVLGGTAAHLSGSALWQRTGPSSGEIPVALPVEEGDETVTEDLDALRPGTGVPTAPTELSNGASPSAPPLTDAQRQKGVSLQPPASLRDQLAE